MKKIFFWILSFIITVSFAYFQKITGPTYPIKNSLKYKESILNYHLPRSCTIGKNDCLIKIKIEEARQRVSAKGKEQRVEISELKSESDWVGTIVWRRYKTSDEWSFLEMDYADKELRACIEEQPPAGKIEYKVEIGDKKNKVLITQKSVITRFKGFVPPYVLIPHIIFMFLFMLFSVRIFLGTMDKKYVLKHSVLFNIFFLVVGGFIFGPITQKYAFGFWWTGFPFGHDLTDNKALIMMICWIMAAVSMYKSKYSRRWIMFALAVTFAMYLIPHSLLGSELDYNKQVAGNRPQATSNGQVGSKK